MAYLTLLMSQVAQEKEFAMMARLEAVKKLKKTQATLLRLNIELASVKLRGEQRHIDAVRDEINQAIERIEIAIRPTAVG